MIYLEKNDIWDEVWNRYVESFSCTLDTERFVPENVIDGFCLFLGKELIRDLKQARKDARRKVKQMRKAERQARFRAFMARLKARFMRKKSDADATEENADVPTTDDNTEEQANEQKEVK